MFIEEELKELKERVRCLELVLEMASIPKGDETRIDHIQREVSMARRVELKTLLSRSRLAYVAQARMLAMYLARKTTNCSLESIGRRFDRDHGTVLNAVAAIEDRMSVEPKFKSEVEAWLAKFSA